VDNFVDYVHIFLSYPRVVDNIGGSV